MKRPEIIVYGRLEVMFDSYNSRKEAMKAIPESEGGTYIILPVTRKIQDWELEDE